MAGLDDEQQTEKDTSYSPGSEAETARKQEEPGAGVLPGSGGPDDYGDLDVADEEVNPPRDTGAH